MSMISGVSAARNFLSSQAMQVTALSSIPRIQAGEQPFSLDAHPAGAEAQSFSDQFQDQQANQRQISTDTTGIALSSDTREFLASLPESQKLPIVSMNSNILASQQSQNVTDITNAQASSQVSPLQNQLAGIMSQGEAQRQAIAQALPINQADTESTYSAQAKLIGGGATVEQTLFAGQEKVQQRIYEDNSDNNDLNQDTNLDGSSRNASTRDSEEFKVSGVETNPDDAHNEESSNPDDAGTKPENELTSEEQEQVRELKARDTEVRIHEQAHVAAGGGLIRGGIQYDMQTGPDGRSYAVGGSVNIDTSIDNSSPEAMIAKAAKIKAAALAPAEPSSADRAVAAAATQMQALGQEAKRKEAAEDMQRNLESMNEATSSTENADTSLPEVEAIDIDSNNISAKPTAISEDLTESNTQAQAQAKPQDTIDSQSTNTQSINSNVRTSDEKKEIVRSTVVATSVPTSALHHEQVASSSSSNISSVSNVSALDAPPAPLPAQRPSPVSKGGTSSLQMEAAPLPAQKPAPVSKGGTSSLNTDSEPVSLSSASYSSELQMSPAQERFRTNAISAYQSIRTRAA